MRALDGVICMGCATTGELTRQCMQCDILSNVHELALLIGPYLCRTELGFKRHRYATYRFVTNAIYLGYTVPLSSALVIRYHHHTAKNLGLWLLPRNRLDSSENTAQCHLAHIAQRHQTQRAA